MAANDERLCVACGVEIHRCNGFTKAGDVLEWMKFWWHGAPQPKKLPRELCKLCVHKYEWNREGELVGR